MKNRLIPRATICLAAVCLLGCGGRGEEAGPGKQEGRDSLIIAVNSDPATFDLLYANSLIEGQIGNNIYDCLFYFDDQGNMEPSLAEKYEVSPDGMEYTFSLRRGVTFHNGEEFTARDVAFTIEYGRGTPNGSLVCGLVEEIRIPDDYTITLRIAEPMTSFLYEFAGDQFAIYNEKAVRTAEPYGAFPIGTGAYRFVRREPGVEVELAAFGDYFQGPPRIKRVIFRVIPDDFTAAVALETGEIDFIWIGSAVSLGTLRNNPALTVLSGPSTRVNYVAMNGEIPPFNNRSLRQAVNYGINRESIREIAYEGEAEIKDSMAMPWMAGFAESKIRYNYDPQKAAALAAEAGISPETPLAVSLIVTNANRRAAEVIQQDLAELGITLSIELLEFNTWVTKYYAGEFAIALGGHYMMIKDMNYLGEFYDSANINQGNSARYRNPRVDALFAQGRREGDPAKRGALYQEILDIVQEDAPYAVIASPAIIRAYKRELSIDRVYANGILLRDIAWN